jgi:hypothetical protein
MNLKTRKMELLEPACRRGRRIALLEHQARLLVLKPLLVLLAMYSTGDGMAQHELLYADWYDSAQVAKKAGDYDRAVGFYRQAFARRTPLAEHALDAARVCWLAHDTVRTQGYMDQALVLGWNGDEVPRDSVLSAYWAHASSIGSKRLWERYKAMLMPELKAELEAMFRADQDIRMQLDWDKADSPDSLVRRSVWIPVEAQDARHYARVVEIIKEHGVPSVHQVGLTGNKMIFFAFIHAGGHDRITPWVVKLRASVEKGESPATWYAYVIDRVMVGTTKVTMFGTTGYTDRSDGVTYFTSVLPETVDLVREIAGLPRMGRNGW